MDSKTVCEISKDSPIEACLVIASARAVRLSPSVQNRNWNWNSCAGRGRNLKVCPSAWLFTSTWYARVVCSLELLRGELSRGYTGAEVVRSDMVTTRFCTMPEWACANINESSYRQESPARELCNFSKWRPCNHGTSTTRVIIRAPSRSKRGAARCIDWTFTLNVNSNAMRSTCASHLKKNGDSHRSPEKLCLNMSKFALTSIFLDGCLPTLWRVTAYWTECVDGRHNVSRLSTSQPKECFCQCGDEAWEIACPSKCWTRKETTSNSE